MSNFCADCGKPLTKQEMDNVTGLCNVCETYSNEPNDYLEEL
jgi:hypothetical protein